MTLYFSVEGGKIRTDETKSIQRCRSKISPGMMTGIWKGRKGMI